MAQIFKNCTNCGELLTIFTDSKITSCKNCENEFVTSSLLDESDKTFIKKLSSEQIETTLQYNSLIIQGNDHISNSLFDKAEQCYKQAIDICENRYEAYYGVVRAKTQDFQSIPETSDYLEYAKLAMKYADDDIDSKINANLAKINIFKKS